jgi:hypothetical protein
VSRKIHRTIVYTLYNKFTQDDLLTIIAPYSRLLAADGYYSKMLRRARKCVAQGFPYEQVAGELQIIRQQTTRVLFKWPNGMMLDLPPEPLSHEDVAIILHYIEGIKMARTFDKSR